MMRTFDEAKTYQRGDVGLESPDLLEYARFELSQNRSIQLRISGSSMKPMMDDGDVVTIAPVDVTTIMPQDIVLVTTQSGTALIHRVISLQTQENGLAVLMRGDYSHYNDTPLPVNRVMGRLVALQRKGRGKVIPVRNDDSLLTRIRSWFRRLTWKKR